MNSLNADMVLKSAQRLLTELVDGPEPAKGTWVLDPDPKAGLLGTLDGLTAQQASRHIVPEESSIAGHANHLNFSLSLMNRWAAGEKPFAGADWKGSWNIQTVDDIQWQDLRRKIREQAHGWMKAMQTPREWNEEDLAGVFASIVHLAYHLGAIRNTLEAAKKAAKPLL